MNFKNKIQNLILSINTKTGQSDETLTDAIQTLIDNSGGGVPITGRGAVIKTYGESHANSVMLYSDLNITSNATEGVSE